jgi:phosphorylcholine metabolism protein LicD
MAKQKKRKIDAFAVHEALDRTCIISYMVNDWIIEHFFIQDNPKLLKKAEKAARILTDLYQDVGNIDTDKLK